jgi:hypothetical protein
MAIPIIGLWLNVAALSEFAFVDIAPNSRRCAVGRKRTGFAVPRMYTGCTHQEFPAATISPALINCLPPPCSSEGPKHVACVVTLKDKVTKRPVDIVVVENLYALELMPFRLAKSDGGADERPLVVPGLVGSRPSSPISAGSSRSPRNASSGAEQLPPMRGHAVRSAPR